MTIDISAYEGGLYTNFGPFAVQKISSNHVLFCLQITAAINKIEKNTQHDLDFIFYEISEYINFFCLKIIPSQKKMLVNTNFVKMMLHVNEVREKLWEIHVSSNNLAHNGFATASTI